VGSLSASRPKHIGNQESNAVPLHTYDLRFHLSGEANGKTTVGRAGDFIYIDAPHLAMVHCAIPPAARLQSEPVLMDGYISRIYGIKHPAPIVRFVYEGGPLVLHTLLFPYRLEKPYITMSLLPVLHADKPCAPIEAFALQVRVDNGDCAYTDTYFSANIEDKGTYRFAGQVCDEELYFSRRPHAEPIALVSEGGARRLLW
jgi:hypothetical protein